MLVYRKRGGTPHKLDEVLEFEKHTIGFRTFYWCVLCSRRLCCSTACFEIICEDMKLCWFIGKGAELRINWMKCWSLRSIQLGLGHFIGACCVRAAFVVQLHVSKSFVRI